jgi:general secretion pathway protein B
MSVILDALKKLDREKSSRRNGAANIAVEILRPDPPQSGKRIPLYFAVVSLTAIATVAITYAVMVGFGFLSKSTPPAAVNPPAPSQQVSPAPPDSSFLSRSIPPAFINPPAPSQQVVPTPPSHEPIHEARDEMSPVPPKIQNPAEGKKLAPSPGENKVVEKKVDQKVIPEEVPIAPQKTEKPVEHTPNPAQQLPKESVTTTPPSLKISAIVWYEEPSKRLAMINGNLTSEGSFIEGVKVEEIFPNRVRFSFNGQPFEISIDH